MKHLAMFLGGVTLIFGLIAVVLFPIQPKQVSAQVQDTVSGDYRGYLTTPQELQVIKTKAGQSKQPYKDAADSLMSYVTSDPYYWPHGTFDICSRGSLDNAAALMFAKGMAYHMTGDEGYALSAKQRVLQLTDSANDPSDMGGDDYSGGNDCILTHGRHSGYIDAYDLTRTVWTPAERDQFFTWLATKVYRKVSWASDMRSDDWGIMGSVAAAKIADVLEGSGKNLVERSGSSSTSEQAYSRARQKQLNRMNGVDSEMTNSVCSSPLNRANGIQANGAIPEETGRDSTGCGSRDSNDLEHVTVPALVEEDNSWNYMMTAVSGLLTQAELHLRRGDRSMYDNLYTTASGNKKGLLWQAILYTINTPGSTYWGNSRKSPLEIAFSRYHSAAKNNVAIMCELGLGTRSDSPGTCPGGRTVIGDTNTSMPHFTTLTHGFSVSDETPSLPPTIPPPGGGITDSPRASIQVTMTVDKETVQGNGVLTYTISYQNVGSTSATNVEITSPIPQHTTYVSDSLSPVTGVYDAAAKNVKWKLGALASGEQSTVRFQVKVDSTVDDGDTGGGDTGGGDTGGGDTGGGGTEDEVILVGAGDVAYTNWATGAEATAKLLDKVVADNLGKVVVFVAGDIAYNSGTDSEFKNYYDPTWGRHKALTKPVPGNHEYRTSGASGYYNYFGAIAGDRTKGYYAYDHGEWRIYALNTNDDDCRYVPCNASSEQVAWLVADMAANPRQCTAAIWHHPRWSAGEHGDDSAMQPLWKAFYDAGGDLVINGHDHNYERFAPMDVNGNKVSESQGMREFVVGMGGRGLRSTGSARAASEVRNSNTFGVMQFTLRPTSYEWKFLPVAGKTFTDTGTTNCR